MTRKGSHTTWGPGFPTGSRYCAGCGQKLTLAHSGALWFEEHPHRRVWHFNCKRKDSLMTKVGSQDGIVAFHNRQRDLDPAGTLLVKTGGKWPDMNQALADVPVDQWKAIDKHQRTEQILVNDHDAADGGEDYRPAGDLDTARARIFLAQSPLDCLRAPDWMTPVCTADRGYRDWYTPSVIAQLRDHFGTVESWCDCRNPTAYQEALTMVEELGLDGAWGQCETTGEFDHAYENGARRMVGSCNAQVLDDQRLALVKTGEVLLSVELYRNVQPNMQPDWRGANAGIGGNCIACYGSDTEGAVYTPVAAYKAEGLYSAGNDSVYGVGLHTQDWYDLY